MKPLLIGSLQMISTPSLPTSLLELFSHMPMTHLIFLLTLFFLERKQNKFITNLILFSVRLDLNSNHLRKQIFKVICKIVTLNFVNLLITPNIEEQSEKTVVHLQIRKITLTKEVSSSEGKSTLQVNLKKVTIRDLGMF